MKRKSSSRPRPTPEKAGRETSVQAKDRAQLRQEKRKKRQRNKLLFLLCLTCVIVLIVLSVTVWFQIKSIVVEGNTRYEEGELIAMSGVETGENMFRLSTKKIEKKLKETYPYIEEVNVKRKLWDSIAIEIKEGKPTGAVLQNKRYTILSQQNRILEISQKKLPKGVYLIKGLPIENPVAGNYLEISEQEKSDALKQVFDLLNHYPLGTIREIDVADTGNIALEIGKDQRVEFGNTGELEYKFKMVQEIVTNKLGENEKVIIDARTPSKVVVSQKKKS